MGARIAKIGDTDKNISGFEGESFKLEIYIYKVNRG
jgi:hypothetical protein